MKPVPLSVVDELCYYFESGKATQRRWFSRKMKALSDEEQERVWQELERRGHKRPGTERTSRHYIVWTDAEWDKLTEHVWTLRKNNPAEPLLDMARRALPQFPKERQRVIRAAKEIEPLIERLKQRDELAAATTAEAQRLRQQVQQLTEQAAKLISSEEVLGTLTDAEVVERYGKRVLQIMTPDEVLCGYPVEALLSYVPNVELIAQAARVQAEALESQQGLAESIRELTAALRSRPASTPMPQRVITAARSTLPRVTVVGLLPAQQAEVESRLRGRAQFCFVDKNRTDGAAIPDNQDVILLAANFIGHGMQELARRKVGPQTRLVIHHGGISTIARKLDELLPRVVPA